MRQTFEDLIFELEGQSDGWSTTYNFTDVLKLLKLVRQKTLKEAANNADADYNFTEDFDRKTGQNIEVYVLKESILQLDKDSIEI